MALPQVLTFSQSSLEDFDRCPRLFWLRYQQRLSWPEPWSPENDRAVELGQQFHALVQRESLGILVDVQTLGDPLKQYDAHFPAHLRTGQLLTELTLQVPVLGHPLVARFDRLVRTDAAEWWIIDWKTGQSPPSNQTLAQRWQSTIYPYVLVESGASLNSGVPIRPAAVRLLYWHVAAPQTVTPLVYSEAAHTQARQRIEAAVAQILQGTEAADFPLTPNHQRCQTCTYQSYCGRGQQMPEFRLEDAVASKREQVAAGRDWEI
ncbi:MAG: PD-(D/E)XK nuclease family protein [Gloeomargaritaceae cyanobacterium C42_A2020_066]|nr:PD-(D/E)XK nuclease family protein [Gloeomargaritaceae cyanobacterium C42_A2020_066]